MRLSVHGIRQDIVQSERSNHDADILGYTGTQSGMFSLLPIMAEQKHALIRDHGIHVVKGGRVKSRAPKARRYINNYKRDA
jgi:aspartate aminotransferase/aromatic-amino-acid transaminase